MEFRVVIGESALNMEVLCFVSNIKLVFSYSNHLTDHRCMSCKVVVNIVVVAKFATIIVRGYSKCTWRLGFIIKYELTS